MLQSTRKFNYMDFIQCSCQILNIFGQLFFISENQPPTFSNISSPKNMKFPGSQPISAHPIKWKSGYFDVFETVRSFGRLVWTSYFVRVLHTPPLPIPRVWRASDHFIPEKNWNFRPGSATGAVETHIYYRLSEAKNRFLKTFGAEWSLQNGRMSFILCQITPHTSSTDSESVGAIRGVLKHKIWILKSRISRGVTTVYSISKAYYQCSTSTKNDQKH